MYEGDFCCLQLLFGGMWSEIYILVKVRRVTIASIKQNTLSQLSFVHMRVHTHTHTIFLFVFLTMSSVFKTGKVGCQSQCFRLKFSLCFSLQSIAWGQVIFFFFKYSETHATVVACSNTHVEPVLWTYTFILKRLEYANKDAVGRGPVNKFHFLRASAWSRARESRPSQESKSTTCSLCELNSVTSDGPHHICFLGSS